MYKYILIDGQYICLHQNPLSLGIYLGRDSKSLLLHSKTQNPRVLAKLKRFLPYYFHLRKSTQFIKLPVFGNVCLNVHRGYKIFEFKKKIVTKLFHAGTKKKYIISEIESVKKAGSLDFAPDLKKIDIDNLLYQEAFVKGKPWIEALPNQRHHTSGLMHESVLKCLQKMVLLMAPERSDSGTYLQKLSDAATNNFFSNLQKDRRVLDFVSQFIEMFCHRIFREGGGSVDLIFSHGDFSAVNILNTNKGIRVIDWESAALRNPLYDLYNYFFTEIYYGRETLEIMPAIDATIDLLCRRIARNQPELVCKVKESTKVYRWLYYLERIKVLLEREPSKNLLEVVRRSLDVFKSFEERSKLKIKDSA